MKTKIYTRTGDGGKTSLYGGKRVEKHRQQVVAYGTVDELNSCLGILIAQITTLDKQLSLFLTTIQTDLFTIGAYLAGNNQSLTHIGNRVLEIEECIDRLDASLPPLKNFILPAGSKSATFAHLSRSVCRRAEREIIKLSHTQGENEPQTRVDPRVIMFLNRLSDLLFIIARYLNRKAGKKEVIWKSSY